MERQYHHECYACHAKRGTPGRRPSPPACHANGTSMSRSATPATRSGAAPRATNGDQASAMPATQSAGGCRQVPRLPRKVPRRHRATNGAQAATKRATRRRWMSPSATPATQSAGGCRQVPRLPCDKVVCDEVVCDRVLWQRWCVKECVCVCERWCVCVWKMVCVCVGVLVRVRVRGCGCGCVCVWTIWKDVKLLTCLMMCFNGFPIWHCFFGFFIWFSNKSRGARPSVTTLPNEAMSLKGKQLGTPSCVPADSF